MARCIVRRAEGSREAPKSGTSVGGCNYAGRTVDRDELAIGQTPRRVSGADHSGYAVLACYLRSVGAKASGVRHHGCRSREERCPGGRGNGCDQHVAGLEPGEIVVAANDPSRPGSAAGTRRVADESVRVAGLARPRYPGLDDLVCDPLHPG